MDETQANTRLRVARIRQELDQATERYLQEKDNLSIAYQKLRTALLEELQTIENKYGESIHES